MAAATYRFPSPIHRFDSPTAPRPRPPPPAQSAVRIETPQQRPVVTIPRRKVACEGCRLEQTRCNQRVVGTDQNSCLRCLSKGLRCSLLVTPQPPPALKRAIQSAESNSTALVAPPLPIPTTLALSPSSARGRLFASKLSSALSYHLVTTYLDSMPAIQVGNVLVASTYRNLAEKRFGRTITSLIGNCETFASYCMSRGALLSNHSAIVDAQATTSSSTSLKAFHARRRQASSFLEDRFADLVKALKPKDDSSQSWERVPLFMLVSEGVETSSSQASKWVEENGLLKRVYSMAAEDVKSTAEKKEEVIEWTIRLNLRTIMTTDGGTFPPKDVWMSFVDQSFAAPAPSPSDEAVLDWNGPRILRDVGAPFLRENWSAWHDIATLSSHHTTFLQSVQQTIIRFKTCIPWFAKTVDRLNAELEASEGGNDERIFMLLHTVNRYDAWIVYLLSLVRVRLHAPAPVRLADQRSSLVAEVERLMSVVLHLKVRRMRRAGDKMDTVETWFDLLKTDVWAFGVAFQRLGHERVLGWLTETEVKDLLECFVIIARSDFESVALVELCEKVLQERTSREHDTLAMTMVAEALKDLEM